MRDAGAEAHGASPGEGSGPRQGDPARSAATPRLEMRGVYKAFGGVHVLEDVDFALMPSEVVGLLGDNGAGKSTLIKIITGYHEPDEGTILFDGQPITGLTMDFGRMDFILRVQVYGTDEAKPVLYEGEYRAQPDIPHAEIDFSSGPAQVRRIYIEVEQLDPPEEVHIHIREVVFKE